MPIYWKEYQDRDSINGCLYAVLTLEEMQHQTDLYFDDHDPEDAPPVFEPVKMTVEEFNALPHFTGF